MQKGDATKDSSNDDVKLLRDWVLHSDLSFHEFDPKTVTAIQESLLCWYSENRRKLPWRGDPPPYDGSTAGINKNFGFNTSKEGASQSMKITSYFQSSNKKSKTNNETNLDELPISSGRSLYPPMAYGSVK